MFEDVDNKQSEQPAVQPQNNQPKQQEGQQEEGQVHTMPMDYYLGDKTVEATKGSATAQMPTSQPSTASGNTGGGRKAITIVIILVLALLVIGSGVLLYFTYMSPSTPAETQLSQAPATVEQPTQEPEETEPMAEDMIEDEDMIMEETESLEDEEVLDTGFDPSDIKRFRLSLLASLDTDRDGLTDEEEDMIGTDSTLTDSDDDTYRDGEEIENFYSPLAVGNIRLNETSFVQEYTNEDYMYSFLYPADWVVDPIDEEDPKDLIISSNANEFVNIIIEQKLPSETVTDWYLRQAPTINRNQLKLYKTKNDLNVVESPDGFTAYIGRDNDVYIINYSIGLKDEADYPNMYRMIINSFDFSMKMEETEDMMTEAPEPVLSATCNTLTCFEDLFADCVEGETLLYEVNEISSLYEIIGEQDDFCEVNVMFQNAPDERYLGKEMSCLYDNTLDFEEALQVVEENLTTEANSCSGSLYDELSNL